MAIQAPKIDARSYEDIVAQTTALAQQYTGWQPIDSGADIGSALIRIFGRMVEQVLERLNQAPEKNYVAFLALIGTQIRPPRPARVPLTFQLAAGSQADALVPARTQVAALQAEGETSETLFETDDGLAVTRAQLCAVYVHQPNVDQYDDYTQVAGGETDTAFPVFTAKTPVEHSLYLARDDVFALPNPKTVTFTLSTHSASDAAAFAKLPLAWEYWDGTTWQTVPGSSVNIVVIDNALRIVITNLPLCLPVTIGDIEAAWLRIRLRTPLPPEATLPPSIGPIGTDVQVLRSGLTPALTFTNSVRLDLSKDFYPFGEQPRLNDAFYLALPAEAARPGANININVTPTDHPPVAIKPSSDLTIQWEIWDGATWAKTAYRGSNTGVLQFTTQGTITAVLPPTIAARTVNEQSGYWLRGRIIAGNYGVPLTAQVTSTTDAQGRVTKVDVAMTGGYGPPSLASLTIDVTARHGGPLDTCLTYNNGVFVDCTAIAQVQGSFFSAFTSSEENRPTLYLGFDQPFDNRPMTLYVQVDAPQPGEVTSALHNADPTAAPPRVTWEYSDAAEWRSLGVIDETNAFTESGVLRFIGPADLHARTEFRHTRYWLRARWDSGTFLLSPRLRRVLTNTTWATQATTVLNEILGSGTGEANQVFRSAQAPVLLGARLEVQELDLPSTQEHAALVAVVGEDAVSVVRDVTGQIDTVWVRWLPVSDFYGSGPRDRHYAIDYVTGEIRFGDGQHGLVPTAGRNNVRLAVYRTSGGVKGNRPAQTISQLKTAVPSIESVTNYESSEGGADQENLEEMKERGPKVLRHKERAVTVQDIEDLALEAAPDVARAQALMPDYDPISLEWLPLFHLPLTQPGDILVSMTWEGGQPLTVTISGPGRGTPSTQREGTSPFALTCPVPPEQFVRDDVWQVAILNAKPDAVRTGRVSIVYPVGSLTSTLDVPAQPAYAPHSQLRQGGQVELIIVPRTIALQPTPNLSLVSRVRGYIQARCAPTLSLIVTEPDWVEVTVTAQVVPVSLDTAEVVQTTVTAALERFLHPLTGGFDGRGWPFGRRPHVSDLHALLESVTGVDYVGTLSVVNKPSLADIDPAQPGETPEDDLTLPRLGKERRDRFLIFSGRHNITVVASSDGARGGM